MSKEHSRLMFSSTIPRRRKLLILAAIAFVLALGLFASHLNYTSHMFTADPLTTNISSTVQSTGTSNEILDEYIGIPPTATKTVTNVVTETATVTLYKAVESEPIHFALIMFSEDSASEGAVLIKSILMYNSHPSYIHVICDEAAQQYLEKRLSLVNRPTHNVRVFFYPMTWQQMSDRVSREGTVWTDHSAGYAGLMKLFIHEILPTSVHQVIFVDTDAFFIFDPAHLHALFSTLFTEDTAIAMPSHPDQDAPDWNYASQICSCIILLDLRKLRACVMMDSKLYRNPPSTSLHETHPPSYPLPESLSPPAFRALYGAPNAETGQYENVRLGDQGYFWAIVKGRSDIFKPLPFEWEVSSCLMDMYMTGLAENVNNGDDMVDEQTDLSHQIHLEGTPQEGKVVLPKILHFNCLHGTPRYFNWEGWSDSANDLNKRWGPTMLHHVRYKWIWLNTAPELNPRGSLPGTPGVELDGQPVPTIEVVTMHIKFADERYAAGENVF